MVPFVYLASVCWSLQCLISTLTQAGGGNLLFRFACSVALRGGSGPADRYRWRVWGALAVFQPHWFCPHSRVCAFPVYTAQAPGCSIGSRPCVVCDSSFQVLHKIADSVGPAFCAFPTRAAQAIRSLTGALSPGAVRLLPSAVPACFRTHQSGVCALCLFWGAVSSRDPPGGCQPSRISGSLWLETGSLFAVW